MTAPLDKLLQWLPLGDAVNILMVIHKVRPVTYVVIPQELAENLLDLLIENNNIEVLNKGYSVSPNTGKTFARYIIVNLSEWTYHQAINLSQDEMGIGKLLGYICTANEMESTSKYCIKYFVNDQELYSQVASYLDEERRSAAKATLVAYRQFGIRYGLTFRLFLGLRHGYHLKWQKICRNPLLLWKRRLDVVLALKTSFPRTAKYFEEESYEIWLTYYTKYKDVWEGIIHLNADVDETNIHPNLEGSWYQLTRS